MPAVSIHVGHKSALGRMGYIYLWYVEAAIFRCGEVLKGRRPASASPNARNIILRHVYILYFFLSCQCDSQLLLLCVTFRIVLYKCTCGRREVHAHSQQVQQVHVLQYRNKNTMHILQPSVYILKILEGSFGLGKNSYKYMCLY